MDVWSSFLGGSAVTADDDRYMDSWLKGLDFGGVLSSAGVRVTISDALSVPGIAANVNVLAEDLSKVPLVLMQKHENGDRVQAVDHPLYWILKNGPAPWLSSFAWRRTLLHNALSQGNGYSRIWRDERSNLDRLTLLQPGATTVRWQEDGEPFFDVNAPGGLLRGMSWQDVLHIPYRGTNECAVHGGILGVSPIIRNRETVALMIAAEKFAGKFFSNGAKPSAVLEMDKKLPNDEVAARMRAGIERVFSGIDNSFKVAILELGLKLKEFSFDPTKAQMTETRKEGAVQACTMYGTPPHKIGILDKATFSNIEQQGIDYVTGPCSSLAQCVESAIEVSCLTPDERRTLYVEHNLDALMRGDLESRYRAYAIGRQWGWLNVNRILGKENENGIGPEGDVYLTPLNMLPANDTRAASERANRPAPAPAPTKDD